MSVIYMHRQRGTLMWAIFGGGIAIALVVLLIVGGKHLVATPLIVVLVLALCLLLFHSLVVTVSDKTIRLKFGIGLIRKHFAIADITRATAVRNRWYYAGASG